MSVSIFFSIKARSSEIGNQNFTFLKPTAEVSTSKLALRTVWQRLDVNYLGKFHSLGVKAFLPDLWREGVSEGAKLSLCTTCKNSVLNSSLVVFYLLHGNVLEVTTDLEMTAISIL